MLLIARRTALAAALLLVMPLTVWLSGWLWQPGLPVAMLKSLWWVTETVTQPWGIITHVVLCGWFLWCLRFRLRAALILFLILAAAITAGRGRNHGSRRGSGPRPFVIWLENTRQVPVTQFYALKRKERAKLVHEQLAQAQDIPSFYANTGRRRRGLLSRQVTPCLPPAGRYSLRDCCGRVAAGAQSRCCWCGRRR